MKYQVSIIEVDVREMSHANRTCLRIPPPGTHLLGVWGLLFSDSDAEGDRGGSISFMKLYSGYRAIIRSTVV